MGLILPGDTGREPSVKIGYLDCFSGISGDMTLAALIHAGLPEDALLSELKKLDLPGYRVEILRAKRGAIVGTQVRVHVDPGHPERDLNEILSLIDRSGLSRKIKEKSKQIFLGLGKAEAEVHGTDLSSVTFHEVGAVDSIVDIVGSVIGIDKLGIQCLTASPVNVGKGAVDTKHGILPVPTPATVLLLKGKPTYSQGPSMELTTPTGAAILAGLAQEFGDLPMMQVEQIGYGFGSTERPDWPNALRILIGERSSMEKDSCWMIESNIDDMNPETYGYLMERLFEEGALDAFFTPIVMKKGRPAIRVSILSPQGKEENLVRTLFVETTSIGVRRYRVERDKLKRDVIQVETPFGSVAVKIGLMDDEVVNFSPEYEDCRKLAKEKDVPFKEVFSEALRAAKEKQG
jgi:uncharacterized protein (TIGR00299 family) protein